MTLLLPIHAQTTCSGPCPRCSVCRVERQFCRSLGQGFTPALAMIRSRWPRRFAPRWRRLVITNSVPGSPFDAAHGVCSLPDVLRISARIAFRMCSGIFGPTASVCWSIRPCLTCDSRYTWSLYQTSAAIARVGTAAVFINRASFKRIGLMWCLEESMM